MKLTVNGKPVAIPTHVTVRLEIAILVALLAFIAVVRAFDRL